jgi:hypothetical protein
MEAAFQQSQPARRWFTRPRRLVAVGAVIITAVLGGVLAQNQVSSAVTEEDAIYVAKILQETGHGAVEQGGAASRSFDEQINLIAAVQDAVLAVAPKDEEIPFDRGREPRDLYELRQGLCFDRSRVIEKALNYAGLRTRHVAVYSTAQTGSALKSLATPQVSSHAVTEVETARGWMVVDPNARWIGLTAAGRPFTLAALKADPALAEAPNHPAAKDRINNIFRSDFTYVIGLFSRHGRFYAPYTPVPDVNWRQMLYNLSD